MLTRGFILVLSAVGIAQALFLCVYLFSLRGANRNAHVFLGMVIMGLTIRIGKSIFNNYLVLEPWVRNLGISGILLVGPFLWFYGKALFGKHRAFSRERAGHLLPFILFVASSAFIPNQGDLLSLFIYVLVFLHLAAYLVVSWRYLLRHRKRADRALAAWYRNILLGVSVIWGLYTGIFLRLIPFYILGAVSFSFLIYIFSYQLLRRHTFVLEKYRDSKLDRSASQDLVEKVKALFAQEDFYLQNEASLKKVAEKLNLNPREVSQAINQNEGKNFSEFVNYYRVEKAKTLLSDPKYQNEKIASIAYDSGFSTVTSFNIAFKAQTHLTPSQYRSQYTAS